MKKTTLFVLIALVLTCIGNVAVAAVWEYDSGFAHGTGTYNGKPIQWKSFINSDFYYQFKLSVELKPEDIKKIVEVKDYLDRPYDAKAQKGSTWIGASNDWAVSPELGLCKETPRGEECDDKQVTAYYIKALQRAVPSLKLKVAK